MTAESINEEPGRDPMIADMPVENSESVGTPVIKEEQAHVNKGFDHQPAHEDLADSDL